MIPGCAPSSPPGAARGLSDRRQLDLEAARADPKPLVGFSDITYLHLALHRAGVPGGFHGPLLNWNDDFCDARCAENLRRALMEVEPIVVRSDPAEYTARFSAGGPVTGTLLGGNFDSISRSVGWALPDLDGAILLLEDHHGTGLGQIDRCFAQLVHGGHLDRVAGSRSARSVSSRPPKRAAGRSPTNRSDPARRRVRRQRAPSWSRRRLR